MNTEAMKSAIELGNRLGHVFIATADSSGLPHIAASGRISYEPEGKIGVSEWFCPGTLANIRINPRISIVVWDPENDNGYQLLGSCDKLEDISMMDGISPELEKRASLPQVERKIIVKINSIIRACEIYAT